MLLIFSDYHFELDVLGPSDLDSSTAYALNCYFHNCSFAYSFTYIHDLQISPSASH